MKYLARSLLGLVLAGSGAYVTCWSGCDSPTVGNPEVVPDMTVVSTYSCDQQSAKPPQCKEFSEISPSQPTSGLEALCSTALTPGPCSRATSYGGCRTKNATYTYTVWFYPGGTMFSSSAQVQTYCGAAYVPPN